MHTHVCCCCLSHFSHSFHWKSKKFFPVRCKKQQQPPLKCDNTRAEKAKKNKKNCCQLTFGDGNGVNGGGGVRLIYSAIVGRGVGARLWLRRKGGRRWRGDISGGSGKRKSTSTAQDGKGEKTGKEKEQEANGRRRRTMLSSSSTSPSFPCALFFFSCIFGRRFRATVVVSRGKIRGRRKSGGQRHWSHNCIIATFLVNWCSVFRAQFSSALTKRSESTLGSLFNLAANSGSLEKDQVGWIEERGRRRGNRSDLLHKR